MDTGGSDAGRNDNDIIEEECRMIVGTDWRELDETVRSSIAKAVQDRFKPY